MGETPRFCSYCGRELRERVSLISSSRHRVIFLSCPKSDIGFFRIHDWRNHDNLWLRDEPIAPRFDPMTGERRG